MKCIDQMPMPIDAAPPASQTCRVRDCASDAMRPEISSAVKEASVATTSDAATSQKL